MHTPLTPEQARAALDREGISIAEFCRKHDLNRNLVSDLLNGRKKGKRGEAHRAAVLLGIKDGVVPPDHTIANQGCCPAPRTERSSDDA